LQDNELLSLKGVGIKTCERLEAIGIHNIQDLLFHLPFRYQDRTKYIKINNLKLFSFSLIKANVISTEIKFGRRRSLLVWLEDETGVICLRYFYFSMQQKRNFASSLELEVFGEARPGAKSIEMIHPETGSVGRLKNECLTPVYPAGKGLNQLTIRKLIAEALKTNLQNLEELLPEKFLQDFKLRKLKNSLRIAHQPPAGMELKALQAIRKRLVFEEIIAQHFVFKKIKKVRAKAKSVRIISSGTLQDNCLKHLGFELTKAQCTALAEITKDLKTPGPMQRLLQGDVGSGKTIVALLAALECIEAGYQVAFMAPTEILVEQHFDTIKKLIDPLGLNCGLLLSSMSKSASTAGLQKIAQGKTNIVVGTHALFQSRVIFNNLALIIVDEQHRFGVKQRMRLLQKSSDCKPHQLIMTATPIPRTLTMTFYSYLDYSTIDELPPGRAKINTVSMPQERRPEIIDSLRKYCKAGRQAYWVCPLVDESETLQCQAAIEIHTMLSQALPELTVGLVHGRLGSKDKDKAMTNFKNGLMDILVATTVVEVGVDVANASLIVIDNAERLGLSQLHQLRGRVGRGAVASHCVLLYKTPLSDKAKARLEIMRKTTDGFKIAERDLEIRGPGELLGTKQTGDIKFKIADLQKDKALINQVLKKTRKIEKNLSSATKHKLIARWVGKFEAYMEV